MKIQYILFSAALFLCACNDDVLDRPQLTSPVDDNYWRNETDIELFANGFYSNYFVGYNSGWGSEYTLVRGYTFSDDLTGRGPQSHFESNVPSSRASTRDRKSTRLNSSH